MATWLKRLFWLSLLSGAAYAGWALYASRQTDDADSVPEWPPLDPPESTGTGTTTPAGADPESTTPPATAEPASFAAAGGATTPTIDQADQTAKPSTSDRPGTDSRAQPTASDRWAAPVDGACPPGYPIKANDNSGIYHVPGGRFYERTAPERCYRTAEDAANDGYRAAKA